MNTKQTTITAGGVGTAAIAAIVALSLNSAGDAEFRMDYFFERNSGYSQTLVLESPENFTADITELYLNGELVTDCVLPYGRLTSIPLVYSDMEACSLKFYKMGDEVGNGTFDEDGVLTVTVDAEVLDSEESEEADIVEETPVPEITAEFTEE